jgi:enterochelin esterase-like enzyme
MSSMLRDPVPAALEKPLADADATNARLRLFYYSAGERDQNFAAMKAFHESLTEKKVNHRWETKQGAHEWKVWRESLYEIIPLLFR